MTIPASVREIYEENRAGTLFNNDLRTELLSLSEEAALLPSTVVGERLLVGFQKLADHILSLQKQLPERMSVLKDVTSTLVERPETDYDITPFFGSIVGVGAGLAMDARTALVANDLSTFAELDLRAENLALSEEAAYQTSLDTLEEYTYAAEIDALVNDAFGSAMLTILGGDVLQARLAAKRAEFDALWNPVTPEPEEPTDDPDDCPCC